jgi:hypothetical protein
MNAEEEHSPKIMMSFECAPEQMKMNWRTTLNWRILPPPREVGENGECLLRHEEDADRPLGPHLSGSEDALSLTHPPKATATPTKSPPRDASPGAVSQTERIRKSTML